MMPERVLVCGGRRYGDQAMLFGVLDMLSEERVINCVMQGGASGADKLARMWAISRNHHVETFNADWAAFGKAAGPFRNQRMIDEGKPTLVLAFAGGRGTADMTRRARSAGMPVQQFP